MTPDERYTLLVASLRTAQGVSSVTEGKGFGSSGQLKVDGRIFAMLVRGELVLKLPRARVEELVRSGEGKHFDAGKGRPMREWFVLSPESKEEWEPLASEAYSFVRSKG
ncbi:MAG TPA: hypothetical protein VGK28_10680 [Candidatus Dormibacteraeota bacterium]